MLAVESKKRITMSTLLQNEWIQGGGFSYSATPLMTPTLLAAGTPFQGGPRTAEAGVKQAFHAFHVATREGFRLLVSKFYLHLSFDIKCFTHDTFFKVFVLNYLYYSTACK